MSSALSQTHLFYNETTETVADKDNRASFLLETRR